MATEFRREYIPGFGWLEVAGWWSYLGGCDDLLRL